MLLSAVSVLVVAQSSSKFPEGLMNNSVYNSLGIITEEFRWCTVQTSVASSADLTETNIYNSDLKMNGFQ